jgi:acyl-coenzyme A synthetase/AMP-(fatty) acid ligase
MEPEMLPLLRYAYVAGEPLTPDLLAIWGKTKIICNGYGCSETPMSVTRCR